MECMANSDNVIRRDLPPNYVMSPILLRRSRTNPPRHRNTWSVLDRFGASSPFSTLYDPPIPEFAVIKIDIPAGELEKHPKFDGPSITVVIEGKGSVEWNEDGKNLELGTGDVFYAGAGTCINIRADEKKLVLYRAFVEVRE